MLHESPKPRDEYKSYTCRNMKYRLKFHIWLRRKMHDDVFTMIAVVTLAAKNYFQIVCPNMINYRHWDPYRNNTGILRWKMWLQLTQPPVLSHWSGRQCRLSRFQERPWCAYRDCDWNVHEPAMPNEELGSEWRHYCDHVWGYTTATNIFSRHFDQLGDRVLTNGNYGTLWSNDSHWFEFKLG